MSLRKRKEVQEVLRPILVSRILPLSVVGLTAVLWICAFPPIGVAEAAYIFAIPFCYWAFWKPPLWRYLAAGVFSGFAAWFILLFWLRHVTWLGLTALSAYLALYFVLWLWAVWWTIPRMEDRGIGVRLSALLGLAGWWVVLEYLRGVLFTGFGWLPLAASQWDRAALLQILAYTGSTGLSFVLIFFNLGLAAYVRRILSRARGKEWYERICYEFYFALTFLVVAATGLIWADTFGQRPEVLFRGSLIQPYIGQEAKWDSVKAADNLRILRRQTLFASFTGDRFTGVDIIFWPESATPHPILGHADTLNWTEDLVREIEKPILMGNMAVVDGRWYNIVCAVTPKRGLVSPHYAKMMLVPFGEYVPLERFLPFVKKVVPLEGSFNRGERPEVIPIVVGSRTYKAGALVCYEDIFPALSRKVVGRGADFVFVATNNAWYGEEGGAHQHAAHSVLRAVETRRPFIRCGNSGWSGWIDEYGNVRQVSERPDRGIYFRGSDTIEVKRDRRWNGQASFYLVKGDWFVGVCGLLVVLGFFSVFFSREDQYQVGDILFGERV